MTHTPEHLDHESALLGLAARNGLTRREILRLFGAAAGGAAVAGVLAPGGAEAFRYREPVDAFRPRYAGRAPQGSITIMEGATPNNLDPNLRNAVPEFTVNQHVYDMMLKRDAKTLTVVPNIVREWENVDDTTWVFRLVSGARFHDGTPVNAEAAKFSLDRLMRPRIGNLPTVNAARVLSNIDTTEVVDDLTFRVKTTSPSPILLDLLTAVEIVPPSYFSDDSEEGLTKLATKPMGSGPYKFKEWIKNDRLVVEANTDYWNGAPAFESIIFKPVPELSTRLLALTNGEAHIITNVAPDQVDQVNRSGTARVSQVTGGRIIFVGIRHDKLFSDKRARQALNISVNFDAINRALLNGAATRAKAPAVNPPNQIPNLEPFPYNVDRAKQLLREANFPMDATIPMQAPTGRYVKDKEIAQALAQNWQRQLGLNIDLKILDWSLYAGTILPSKEPDDLFFLGLGSSFTGQGELFYFSPDFSLNYTRWNHAEFNEKFAELSRTLDEGKRRDLMYRLQEILWDECPWVFIYHQVDFYGVSNKIDWEARADERIYTFDSKWR